MRARNEVVHATTLAKPPPLPSGGDGDYLSKNNTGRAQNRAARHPLIYAYCCWWNHLGRRRYGRSGVAGKDHSQPLLLVLEGWILLPRPRLVTAHGIGFRHHRKISRNDHPLGALRFRRRLCGLPYHREALKGDAIMPMEKQLYWAVRCPVCDFPIALDLIQFDSSGIGKTAVWTLEPFPVLCPACRKETVCEKDQVVMWWGPPPSPDFRPHPALQQPHQPR